MINSGFTIIEFLFTSLIISILIKISCISYHHHLVQINRSSVILTMLNIAEQMEEYYFYKQSYENLDIDNFRINKSKYAQHYSLKIESNENKYKIYAIPVNLQAKNDSKCGTLILDSLGNKKITGKSDEIKKCWQ